MGWSDTIAYLILPVLLVVSQFVSQKIMTPKSDDPAQQQTQKILQFLPLLIGTPAHYEFHLLPSFRWTRKVKSI
jgi:membrane protein insertase Oxa1/YidC/SpoIIIJ